MMRVHHAVMAVALGTGGMGCATHSVSVARRPLFHLALRRVR